MELFNMDNPSSSEPSVLDTNSAAAAFAEILEPRDQQEAPDTPEAAAEKLAAEELATQDQPAEAEAEAPAEEPPKVTVKIDGKDVEVTLDELKNGYQRQADYTKKTMEAAEQRKAAEAEAAQARNERQQYLNNLQVMTTQLQGALAEQSNINWQQLIETDPQEYLKQKHLFEQRQAHLQQALGEQNRVYQLQQAEQAKYVQNYLAQQQEELLAKLPEWKDEGKAKAEKAALTQHLLDRGYRPEEVGNVADHRLVLLARDAMRYQQLMDKAKEANRKVEKLPPKVERPGNGEASKPDGRTSAMKQLAKSGRVEDAARVFASFL